MLKGAIYCLGECIKEESDRKLVMGDRTDGGVKEIERKRQAMPAVSVLSV